MSPQRRAWGSLESDVMALLWAAPGPLSPAQVQQELDSDLAYNTVQTILTRLQEKGLVRRRANVTGGRGYEYFPAEDQATAAARRMRAALDGPGDRRAVLRQFTAGLDPADADVLRALLRDPGPGRADVLELLRLPVLPILLLPAVLLPLARLAARAGRPERAARALAAGALVTAVSSVVCLALVAATLADDLPALEHYAHLAGAGGRPLPEPIPDPVAVAATLALGWIGWRLAARLRRSRAITRDLHGAGHARSGLIVADWDSPARSPSRPAPGAAATSW
ncbi:BlaI/MecI/CopY family transcriptional regulator [Dactylosporangium sp. CA-233914]|uniref:BlaI/MecI/CopY family transcriptional regulator n=1 Tax=Dactylosporangium sp. CA-233914 TaxID=3239934 RepID=UPI003D90F84D